MQNIPETCKRFRDNCTPNAVAVSDEHKNEGSDHADPSLQPVEYPQRDEVRTFVQLFTESLVDKVLAI